MMKQLLEDCVKANMIVGVKGDLLHLSWKDCDENEARELLRRIKANRDAFFNYLSNLNNRPSCIYEFDILVKYYLAFGWNKENSVKLARDFLEKDAYLPEDYHSIYLDIKNGRKPKLKEWMQ